jgi:hypothetical protein
MVGKTDSRGCRGQEDDGTALVTHQFAPCPNGGKGGGEVCRQDVLPLLSSREMSRLEENGPYTVDNPMNSAHGVASGVNELIDLFDGCRVDNAARRVKFGGEGSQRLFISSGE